MDHRFPARPSLLSHLGREPSPTSAFPCKREEGLLLSRRGVWLLALVGLIGLLALTACGLNSPASPTQPTVLRPPTNTPAVSPPSNATAPPTGGTPGPTRKPTKTPTPTATPLPTVVATLPLKSPEYGIQAFLWWRPEVADRDLNLIKEMGFSWVKQGMAWRDIEGAGKGVFDWSRADRIVRQVAERGLKLLARIDHEPPWAMRAYAGGDVVQGPPQNLQDFGDFCFAIADRYRGYIQAYQVWNEPNLSREWGGYPPNAAEYVQLLRVCYENIKRADPNALVISAGLAPTGTDLPVAVPDDRYVREMLDAGAARYFDLLGFNAPGYAAPPWVSPDEVAASPQWGGHRFFAFRHVEDIRQIMVEKGVGDKQIAILEMGWTTDPIHPAYSWFRVTEEQQAEYLVKAYEWAREHWAPWIGLMSMIYIADPDWTEEHEQYWWAITLPSYPVTKTRPAYEALKAMPK